jgi:hypothetical protein
MKAVVAPRMEKVFQGHDAKRYGDFGCKTCHGPASADPKVFLPKLALKNGEIAAFSEKPEVAKFMAEKVVPEMAAAMGEPPYDPATKQGFGCAGCHTIEAKLARRPPGFRARRSRRGPAACRPIESARGRGESGSYARR